MGALREIPELDLTLLHRGKVRDLFDIAGDRLLMVASDRISAFDVVMRDPVPDKGRILTAMSAFWFDELADVIGSHLISTDLAALPDFARLPELEGRIMLCRRLRMLPVECIVRGHVAGSAWKEYRERGTIHDMAVPPGLLEADRLAEPMFTPSTKAEVGEHDENISFDRAVSILGADVAEQARALSLSMFRRAADRVEREGFLLADTKFELGFLPGADEVVLMLADEVLTPDSSRFWLASDWKPGATPTGFDKQPVRDHLEALGWDKIPPPPVLPEDVIAATARRYKDAYERITGRLLSDWPGASRGGGQDGREYVQE